MRPHQSLEAPPPPESPPPKPPKPSPESNPPNPPLPRLPQVDAAHHVAQNQPRQKAAAATAAVAARAAGAQQPEQQKDAAQDQRPGNASLTPAGPDAPRQPRRQGLRAWPAAMVSPMVCGGGHHGVAVIALAQRRPHLRAGCCRRGRRAGWAPDRSPLPAGCGGRRWTAAAGCLRSCPSGPRPRRGKWCWRRPRWARLRAKGW